MEDTETLQEIGLTGNQSKVYLSLLKLGKASASQISSITKINRSLVYAIIEELIEQGLVSYFIQNNKKFFQAAPPKEMLEILKEKEQKIKELLPKLEKIKTLPESEKIEVFKGKEGLKTVLNDYLKYKEYSVIGGIGKSLETLPYFMDGWHKRRVKLKIIRHMIIGEEARGTKVAKFPLTEVRFLPKKYETLESTTIYGNKISHTIWVGKPLVIVIESKRIHDAYIKQFNLLWRIAKP